MISGGKNKIDVERIVVGPLQTNCYIVSVSKSKKTIIIDPGFTDHRIQGYVNNNKLDVEFIVNTHGHADHISGNAGLGYPVLIHGKDRDYLTDPMLNLSFLAGFSVERSVPKAFIAEGDIIKLGDIVLEVIDTPGHTPGGICLKLDNLLFSGDTLFFEGIGRSDCPGGDTAVLLMSIKQKLMILPDEVKVFPGHGPETTIGHERKCNPFF